MRVRPAVAALGLAALAACSSSKESKEPAGAGASKEPAAGGNPIGGYLVLPSPEPRVLNPVTQAAFDLATPLVYEGLVGLDAKLDPVPVLAEHWTSSPDGKTITFNLREKVLWHDGKPFSAADVLFTIDTIRKTPTSLWSAYLSPIDKVDSPDEHTVVVTYKQVYGPALASFTFGILPKHLWEGHSLTKAAANVTPVGTGPYKLLNWTPGKRMVVEANKAYWAGRPNIDQIELVFGVTGKDHLAALRAHKLDFADITEPNDWAVLRTPEVLEHFETGSATENTLALVAWNNMKKPLDDARVRVALAHALDRPRVIEDVLGGAGRPVSGPFYPTLWGADPNIAPWPFDLAAAEKMLDAAGQAKKNGKRFAVELLVEDAKRGTAVYDSILAIFRADLDKIGVELKVTYVPRHELIDRLVTHNFEAALFEFSADIADPDPYALLHSSQAQGGENFAGFANPDADKQLDAGRANLDRAKRKEAYYALHKLVHEAEPYTFLYVPERYYAWNRRVHDVSPLDIGALPRSPGMARWWVDRQAQP
jgi:peptide/nickel transport system substrate-binding protein